MVLLTMAWPSAASAASAVLLPVIGGDALDPSTQVEVRRWAREVLEGEGFQVSDAAEVASALPERLRACGPADRCAFELRAVLDADIAVGITVQLAEGQPHRIGVVISDVRGVAHRAEARVDPEAGLPFAMAEALRGALLARSVGRASETASSRPSPPVRPALRMEPSPWNWVVGGLLVLGSVPMLGYGINTAARDGQCLRETSAGCSSRVRFQEGAAIFTGVGLGTLAAGLVVLIVQPIPVFVSADAQSASLHVRGTF